MGNPGGGALAGPFIEKDNEAGGGTTLVGAWRGWKGPLVGATKGHAGGWRGQLFFGQLWPSFIEKDDEASGRTRPNPGKKRQPAKGQPWCPGGITLREQPGRLGGAEQPWRGQFWPGQLWRGNPAGGNPGGGNPGGERSWWGNHPGGGHPG